MQEIMRQPRTSWFNWVVSCSKKEGKRWQEIEDKGCRKNEEIVGSSTGIKTKH